MYFSLFFPKLTGFRESGALRTASQSHVHAYAPRACAESVDQLQTAVPRFYYYHPNRRDLKSDFLCANCAQIMVFAIVVVTPWWESR
jgi:hypothetical protein